MSEENDLKDNLAKLSYFKDRLGNPVSQQEHEAIMGISSDIDKFTIERNLLVAQLEQLRMEKRELDDLREIRDSFAMMVRNGCYDLERSQGMFDTRSTSIVIFHYLYAERRRWIVRLRKLFGKGTW